LAIEDYPKTVQLPLLSVNTRHPRPHNRVAFTCVWLRIQVGSDMRRLLIASMTVRIFDETNQYAAGFIGNSFLFEPDDKLDNQPIGMAAINA